MNYTNFINHLSREFDKELTRGDFFTDQQKERARQYFDRASVTTLTKQIDQLTKIGTPKPQ